MAYTGIRQANAVRAALLNLARRPGSELPGQSRSPYITY
jgi:hypothetical protein